MAEYVAFSWLLRHPRPGEHSTLYSEYILIDRLAINVEMPPSGEPRVVAALKDTPEEARDLALGEWMRQDEVLGLDIDGGVDMSRVTADLDDLYKAHSYWGPVSPHLLAVVRQIKRTKARL